MKTCTKCGYSTENDNAKFCKKCGASLPEIASSIHGDSVEEPQVAYTKTGESVQAVDTPVTSHPPKTEHPIGSQSLQDTIKQSDNVVTAEYLKENSEIGGWLAFFLFSICLGGTISAVLSFAEINSPEYQNSTLLVITDISLGVMLCGLAFYTLYSFVQRKPDAVYLGKLYVVTTFLSNLLALFNGDYDASGFGSLPQIIRGLVWGVIWYSFLCVSSRVEEVIPKEYRKKRAKDYIITGSIYLIPIILFVAGVVELQTGQQEQESLFLQEVQLGDNEYTDGKMIFKLPEGFTANRQELDEPKLTVFNLENDNVGNVTICSDYDTDMSQKRFNVYCKGWEDENAKQYTSKVVCNEKRSINSHKYWYRVTSYETDATVYWRFILLFDYTSGKVAVISAYDVGYDNYIQELLESIRFK